MTINVTVKAKDLPAPPVTPTKPVVPIQPTNPDQPDIQAAPGEHQASTDKSEALKVTVAQKEQPTVAGNLKLPTTGDNLWDSVLYSVFGLIAVCVAFSLFFWRKKQKHS